MTISWLLEIAMIKKAKQEIDLVKVLFVCTGNICRSPTAEGVFDKLVKEAGLADDVHVESAGTTAYHVGEPPDRRSQAAARQRGIDLSQQRARQVNEADLRSFDYILAMDEGHLNDLVRLAGTPLVNRLSRFLDFAPDRPEQDVPDPYYGGPDGFESVLDMIEDASRGLLADIRANHL